jgi:hypothetical protein
MHEKYDFAILEAFLLIINRGKAAQRSTDELNVAMMSKIEQMSVPKK